MIVLVPSTSEISKANVLVYYRNLDSLRYGNEYCVPGRAMSCTPQSLPSKKSEMQQWIGRLYSKEAPPILAGCIAIASLNAAAEPLVCFQALHEPMDGQLHCVIKKGFSWRGRKEFFPYLHFWSSTRSHISGNWGYDSNRVCFFELRQLAKTKPYLPRQHFETVIHAFVTTRLDYWNALYVGVSGFSVARLHDGAKRCSASFNWNT